MDTLTNNIIEINENDFNEKVIEASKSTLVLVDFWAPWCGPCKQLTPVLEKVIQKTDNKAILAKINIDDNQQIAAQLRIQSIPAVFAFKNGQPTDAFQGVIPENKIIEFIEKSLGEKLTKDHSSFYQSIQNLINKNNYLEAIKLLETFMAENTGEFQGMGLYLNCLSDLKRYDEADNFSRSLSKEALSNNYIKSSLQKLEISKKNSDGPSLQDLIKEFKNKPKNLEILCSLADKYFAENMLDDAFELLLNNYRNDKEAIKKKILKFFEALGNNNEKTQEYRKKFSSIMFS
ncbi:thioredoxin [Alphaproteobacteria bacterium]|nr:thioredoxin [Alphaproteobacteria bacterium]